MTKDTLAYMALQVEGIGYLENFSMQTWTDFNSHDPGITVLEQVCWALTDFGYRLEHPIPDLLAERSERKNIEPLRGIPPAAEAFACAPVTLDDLRRLILDIGGVSNVWIEPDSNPEPQLYYHAEQSTLGTAKIPETQPVALQGLWRVRIARDEREVPSNQVIMSEALRRLYAHRPLGIDFTQVDVLPVEDIMVEAHIEIGEGSDAESLTVAILQALSRHISPSVNFKTLAQSIDESSLERLFDGPLLEHGFILDTDLPEIERRSSLRTSDMIRLLMDLPGIRAVRHIRLAEATKLDWRDWELKLSYEEPSPKAPRLLLKPALIQLYRNQIPVRVDSQRVIDFYRDLSAASLKPKPALSEIRPAMPRGRERNIRDYQSILHQFPDIYGIGPSGLPQGASAQERAQVKQLKAYLQLFDQLLADQFAQAANAAALLSGDDPAAPVYATGTVEPDSLELETIRAETYQHKLAEMEEAFVRSAAGIALRRRQLDHLLARVGETFVDPLESDQGTSDEGGWDGLEDRRRLLADLTQLSAQRGVAANSLQPFGPDNKSGLEKRIALKLGLKEADGESFLLVEHILMRALPGDQEQTEPLLTEVATADPYSQQLSFIFPLTGRLRDAEFRAFAENSVRAETPAHLKVDLCFFDSANYSSFKDELRQWHEHRRSNLRAYYGLQDQG